MASLAASLSRTARRAALVASATAVGALPAVTHAQATALPTDPTVRAESLASPILGRTARYDVVLPPRYDSSRRYPVLWLLHGYGGHEQDWVRLAPLAPDVAKLSAEGLDLIVVTPDAANSWYANAVAGDTAARYEDFFFGDLYRDVAAKFAIDSTRQAVAGLSMGGYGATILALRHPGRFRFVAALSPALTVIDEQDPVSERVAGASLRRVFGPHPADHAEYDPYRSFRATPAPALPYFYVAIGTSDDFPTFLRGARAFTDSLRAYHARYEYHERPGGHTWAFWGSELAPVLESLRAVLARVGGP